MSVRIFDATPTDRLVSAVQIIDAGSVDRTISEARIIDMSGVDRIIYSTASSLAVSIAPNSVLGLTAGTGTAVTDAATATPSGGTAPYTYSWTVDSHDNPVAPAATSATAATTTFVQTSIDIGGFYTATFRCTVTDALGATAIDTVSAGFGDTT